MTSEEHQRLLGALANVLEEKEGVNVTHVDGNTPPPFEKYSRLPKPYTVNGKDPDLLGKDQRGVIHIGEAETGVSGPRTEHTEGQLRAWGRLVMSNNDNPVPLHVIVPRGDREAMENLIRRIELGSKLGNQIRIWA